jgi:hypothetical protein
VKVIGCVPVQVPVVAVSTEPWAVAPLAVGKAVFTGGVAAAVTTAVAAEVAAVEVTLLVAVTTTTRVDPTSAAVSV